MVMLPHLEECIKILFVNVNCCSVSLVSLHLMASVQAQKFLEETLVKAELLLFYCQRSPGCPRVPWRKLLWFYKLEVFRNEENPFMHSFISTFRLEKLNVMIEKQDWTVRNLARKVFSLILSLLQIALCYRKSGLQPPKYP